MRQNSYFPSVNPWEETSAVVTQRYQKGPGGFPHKIRINPPQSSNKLMIYNYLFVCPRRGPLLLTETGSNQSYKAEKGGSLVS